MLTTFLDTLGISTDHLLFRSRQLETALKVSIMHLRAEQRHLKHEPGCPRIVHHLIEQRMIIVDVLKGVVTASLKEHLYGMLSLIDEMTSNPVEASFPFNGSFIFERIQAKQLAPIMDNVRHHLDELSRLTRQALAYGEHLPIVKTFENDFLDLLNYVRI